jgi:hypothetical protein
LASFDPAKVWKKKNCLLATRLRRDVDCAACRKPHGAELGEKIIDALRDRPSVEATATVSFDSVVDVRE